MDWMVANWYYVIGGAVVAAVYTFGYFKKRSKAFKISHFV
jgi:hypothetical protein